MKINDTVIIKEGYNQWFLENIASHQPNGVGDGYKAIIQSEPSKSRNGSIYYRVKYTNDNAPYSHTTCYIPERFLELA